MSLFEVAYWHWLLLGMLLIIGEIFISGFILFWFGISALIVAVMMLFFQPVFEIQLLLWGLLAMGLLLLWNVLIRPGWKDRTSSGMGREQLLGQLGQVYEVDLDPTRGRLRFSVPVLGEDEWRFMSQTGFRVGDRVRVVDISGNTLIIEKT